MQPLDIASVLGWALACFLAPGLLLWMIFRDRCPRWTASGLAWVIVVTRRVITGEWNVRIGSESSGPWHVELLLGAINWALAAIFVQCSYQLACHFFRHRKTQATFPVSHESGGKPPHSKP